MEKECNRWRKFFSSSENAIWSILLKYQEIDAQIQTFTDENLNILHSCFFERKTTNTENLETIRLFLNSFGPFFVSGPKGSQFST